MKARHRARQEPSFEAAAGGEKLRDDGHGDFVRRLGAKREADRASHYGEPRRRWRVAALRQAFHEFLVSRAGPEDTDIGPVRLERETQALAVELQGVGYG